MSAQLDNRVLDALSREILEPALPAFRFLRGVFYRDLPSGVRHVVILDGSKQRRSLCVILGLNAMLVAGGLEPDAAGAYVTKYLGAGGVSDKRTGYPMFDRASAVAGLHRVARALRTHGLPWFAGFERLSDVADALGEQFDMLKGELYLHDGRFADAETWLRRYELRLAAMDQTGDVTAAREKTRELLSRCREPDGSPKRR
jgi:hypothetical protein